MNNFRNGALSFLMPWRKHDQSELEKTLKDNIDSFAAPDLADGALPIEISDSTAMMNAHNQQFFKPTQARTTREQINQYRSIAAYPECDNAIDEIVNDSIVQEDNKETVYLDLNATKWSNSVKTKVNDSFNHILGLLDFEKEGKRHFRRWYVDSRIYFHKMIDSKNPKAGIKELRRLDPKSIDFVREIYKDTVDGVSVFKGFSEYFTYTPSLVDPRYAYMSTGSSMNLNIPASAMAYAHSGKTDCSGTNIIGYLQNAIKPANQLRMLEDAMVIFRITRAPERRVFYIDVGNMPGKKATEHMNNVMMGMKNRVVYDSSSGTVKNTANNMSMTEDFWLMRRDGKTSTEISTLPGATQMSEMDDVRWFNRKLYESLKIPLSRMPPDNGGVQFSVGTDVTRDELNFSKFIRGLQNQFSNILIDPLKTHLVLTGVMTEDEWDEEKHNIRVVYAKDSYFEEIKDIEILERRIATLQAMGVESVVGRYVSNEYAMKNILRLSDEEIEEQSKLIDEEKSDDKYKQTDELETGLEEF